MHQPIIMYKICSGLYIIEKLYFNAKDTSSFHNIPLLHILNHAQTSPSWGNLSRTINLSIRARKCTVRKSIFICANRYVYLFGVLRLPIVYRYIFLHELHVECHRPLISIACQTDICRARRARDSHDV